MTARRKTHRELVTGWVPYGPEEIDRYVAQGLWFNLTVCDLLDRNARNVPDRLAAVDDSTEVTWRDLKRRVDRLAIHLHRLGVQYGDFIVLQLPNVVEVLYLYFALNRLGAIPVMCLPRHRRLEIDNEVGLHRAKGICVAADDDKFDYLGMVDDVRSHQPCLELFLQTGRPATGDWVSIDDLMAQEVERDHPSDFLEQFKPDPNDICTELLSGGTTGVPKGIPRTHNDYICAWDHMGRVAGCTDETVTLVAVPALHNSALIALIGTVTFRGGTVVLTNRSRAREQFALIEKYRVTHTVLMPVQITYWMDAEASLGEFDLSSFKLIVSGAQKVRPEIMAWCMEKLRAQVINVFAMAEGPIIATRWDNPGEVQLHTVGRPILSSPDVHVKLVRADNTEVAPGEVGEMAMKGPLAFKGYFRAEEENARAFDEEGYLHSGDLMLVREDGRYIVEGRRKDMIKRGGENIYPERIEDSLERNPAVANCVAIGMPDARFGERLCAFVQPKSGATADFDGVVGWLRQSGIAIYELPERVEVVDSWPLTPVQKIDKRRLRAWITARLFEEGAIDEALGDDFLKRDRITLGEVRSGRFAIEFTGSPS
jgi:2,3-dihydroxybenzoate---[aryl-carrier protein] ligase